MSETARSQEQNPLADSRVRTVIGLSGAATILFVAFAFVDDPTVRWLLVAVAAVDAVVTPEILKRAAVQDDG